MSDSLKPHGWQHPRLPCLSPSPRFAHTHVLWVSDAIQPSHPLSSCLQSFPASGSFLVSQFFVRIRWPKYWSFSFSISPSNEYSGLISYRPGLILLPSVFPIIRVFSNESALRIKWPKYRRLSFSISPSNQYSGLMDGLLWPAWSPRDSQDSSPAPQLESITSLVLSLLYGPSLTSIHD